MDNENYKKGDKLLVKNWSNFNGHDGSLVEIVSVNANYFNVKSIEGKFSGNCAVYRNTRNSGVKDSYCLADRASRVTHNNNIIGTKKREIKALEKENLVLMKYKDDEEEMAAKLKELFAQKSSVKGMAEILRTLKKSDYL